MVLLLKFSLILTVMTSFLCATTTTSSSNVGEMLIIRHGRSRVRHINENDHIRWGLQAFDNLTLDDYDTSTSPEPSTSTVDLSNDTSISSPSSELVGSQLFGSDFWFGSDGSNFLNGNANSSINQSQQTTGNLKRKITADFPMDKTFTPHQVRWINIFFVY